jgi:CRISPR/Cas system-associated endoribonuclease Cas2
LRDFHRRLGFRGQGGALNGATAMGYFNVTYDLVKKEEFDYEPLWAEFDRLGGVKYQDSAYLVELNLTQQETLNHFKKYIHDNDRIMVVEFDKRPSWTKAFKGTNAWINARF